MRTRAGSFDSNPDADLDENEGENYPNHDGIVGNGGGGLRPPTPHLSTQFRPPRDSSVRQSLAPPGPPRQSFIPYAEYGYVPPRPPSMDYPHQVSHEPSSYVDVDENMTIDPNFNRPDLADDEFSLRGNPPSRPSRLRRFARALLAPFRLVKSAFRVPKFLRRKRTSRRPVTQSSGWDFRDPTPVPTSVRQQYSNEGGERAPENVTMVFPEPTTAPPTTMEASAPRPERVASPGVDSAHARSTGHQSHASHHAASHHTAHSPKGAIKPNGDVVRSSGTRTTRSSRSTRTSFSPFSPNVTRLSTVKESGPGRSSLTYSSISHCSSLLHQFTRLFRAIRALYHLPWAASPPKRIAIDFIPALGERSKYRVHRGPPQVPHNDAMAAHAAKHMEPSEGKSWYRPSPQQLQKQLKQRKGRSRHHHSHSHSRSLSNPYQQLYRHGEDAGVHAHRRPSGHRHLDSQPMYLYNPAGMPFPMPNSPYGTQPYYVIPGPPPPPPTSAQAANAGSANGNVLRPPQPTRPASVVSVRPGPRPVQNNSSSQPPPPQSPDPNLNVNSGRNDLQRPPPAAQPMYLLVQGPPSYGNVYPYPYTPPWTPASQRL